MHYRIFDCWRLTAAILVMAYHYLYFAPPGGEVYIDALRRLLPLLDMFFMISGFLIAGRYAGKVSTPRDYGLFLQRRVARLYPLHLATLTFFAAIGVAVALGLVETTEPERWNLAYLPLHLLALHALGLEDVLAFNYPSWSIGAEFFCYALFPLIVFVAKRAGLVGLLALLAIWIAGLEIAGRNGLFPNGNWLEADSSGAYRAFADFTIGAIVASLLARRPFEVSSHAPGLAALGFALTAMLCEWSGYIALAGLALAMLLTALAETARPDSTRRLAFLMPLARVSFGIYLIHPVMETIFFSILWKRAVQPMETIGFYAFWLLPMIATVLVALASERWFERRFGAFLASAGRAPSPATIASA
ncbi:MULTISPECIES: acyltransferase family protein [unclassified Aureimonas]|uniref:acyltransferase family protein n=1 Tax=unclassified Aureimonas TaxID=2615206 RepID=UPI0006F3375D|nr:MULTISPECIES: acyltransferase [unclassified Aureimonas]KQT64416.1 hypothetical protein ASG62_05470 [Aureimonas sp. Leaf427]KQT81606.1 hypothetical protein ASG54_02750 [Aureimonas sp. Leaf460]